MNNEMRIVYKQLDELREYDNNPRNNDGAVAAVAASIEKFGWKQPIVVDAAGVIVAGHTRAKAAAKLGLHAVPCVIADDLTEDEIRAYRLADNKTAELAGWDFDKLDAELEQLAEMDMEAFGFKTLAIDGHDFDAIEEAFATAKATKGMPTAIVITSVKGKDVSFMENDAGWHGKAPNDAEYEQAMAELNAKLAELEA